MKSYLKVLFYIVLPINLILAHFNLYDNKPVWYSWIVICGLLGWFSDNIFPDKKGE